MSLGELIVQGRFVVTSECPRTYEQILNYQWEDLTPNQLAKGKKATPLKKDVDLVDAAQYAVSNYVPPPKPVPKITAEQAMTSDFHRSIRKQIRKRKTHSARGEHDLGNMRV
jgi:hypothetical protein